MLPRILVLGPHGAGKSTLVRQVMSLYERRLATPGGVGALPLGYELRHMSDVQALGVVGGFATTINVSGPPALVVLGNYEETGRDRYGMHQFERYQSNFVAALQHALLAKVPVLMEGGFTKPRRLATEDGKRFCAGLQIVWLSPDDSLRCARTSVTREQWRRSNDVATSAASQMIKSGAEVWTTKDRQQALSWVCSVVDQTLDWRVAKIFSTDYR